MKKIITCTQCNKSVSPKRNYMGMCRECFITYEAQVEGLGWDYTQGNLSDEEYAVQCLVVEDKFRHKHH